jgi:hypothetical protein
MILNLCIEIINKKIKKFQRLIFEDQLISFKYLYMNCLSILFLYKFTLFDHYLYVIHEKKTLNNKLLLLNFYFDRRNY